MELLVLTKENRGFTGWTEAGTPGKQCSKGSPSRRARAAPADTGDYCSPNVVKPIDTQSK